VETQSGQPSHYLDYVSEGKTRYEIEHVWANHPERHSDEFSHPVEFAEHRNLIGGLLLLPKALNASYSDLPYEEKLPHYNSQNLLARSLNPQCYANNPGFPHFKETSEPGSSRASAAEKLHEYKKSHLNVTREDIIKAVVSNRAELRRAGALPYP
jgi:hypothetical protein